MSTRTVISCFAALTLLACSASKGSGDEPDEALDADPGDRDPGSGFDAAFDTRHPPVGEDSGGLHPTLPDTGPQDTNCATSTVTATAVPLDIFIMQDQSGSMKDTTGTGETKWNAVKSAFKTFMADPASAGLGVGLQYFGQSGFFSGGASTCDVAVYAKADVEIAPLPGVGSAINTSLTLHTPFTDTPTGPALQGALQHARAWQKTHPGHVVNVVLATDGLPTACTPLDIPAIAALATAAMAEKPPIRTYVIGVLSSDDLAKGGGDNLNQISMAGNGANAFVIDTSTDVSKSFLDALAKIRGTSLACEYVVPTGTGVDYGKVNVLVTVGGSSATIPYVGSKAKCDAKTGGWYYDIPPESGTPTKILTCDATCSALSLDSGGKIDIQVGCATVRPK